MRRVTPSCRLEDLVSVYTAVAESSQFLFAPPLNKIKKNKSLYDMMVCKWCRCLRKILRFQARPAPFLTGAFANPRLPGRSRHATLTMAPGLYKMRWPYASSPFTSSWKLADWVGRLTFSLQPASLPEECFLEICELVQDAGAALLLWRCLRGTKILYPGRGS